MKTFLKIGLLVIAAILAIKLLPLIFSLVCFLAAAVLGALVVGVSTLAALLGSAIVVAILLSPLWVPVLAIVGLVILIRRGSAGTRRAVA